MKETKTNLSDLIVDLLVIVKRNETGWERHFSDEQLRALRRVWNDGLFSTDQDYWHD